MEMLRSGWMFMRENDLRTIAREFNSKNAHPFIQFVKYGFCGVFATVVHNMFFAILSHWLNPAIDTSLGDDTRAVRATVNNGIAFIFSNFAAYYTNAKWVFVQGRHKPIVEFFIFTGVSCISFVVGILIVPFMIKGFGSHTWVAQIAFIIAAAMINYICRKFIVFKK